MRSQIEGGEVEGSAGSRRTTASIVQMLRLPLATKILLILECKSGPSRSRLPTVLQLPCSLVCAAPKPLPRGDSGLTVTT
jgi:hypothetical protein